MESYYSFWVSFQRTHYLMRKLREKELKKLGISIGKAVIMAIVKNSTTPVTPAEIAKRRYQAPNTITAILNRMEKQGLIRKVKDLDKKNMVRVEITEKGEEIYKKVVRAKVLEEIIINLSPEERDTLTAMLNKLHYFSTQKIKLQTNNSND